jgi:glycosyltransferase involved in cell wall biosynthesis
MQRPLYVEVGPLLEVPLTGIGRFVARLVEALSQVTPLCLFTQAGADGPGVVRRRRFGPGEAIALGAGSVAPADADVDTWVRTLLARPRTPMAPAPLAEHTCLYTLLRPAQRHFARELSILYDFTPLLLPWAHVEDTRVHLGGFFSQTAALSDKAVAISRATQADAQWLCSLPPDDVVVAYPGPSLCVRAHASAETVQRSPQLILVVSTLEPRKNAAFVRDWFLQTRVLAPDTALYWVGPKGWLWEGLGRRAGGRGRGRDIKLLGILPDRQLCELYRRASFTIYPSLYEGFGFPVLDSLRHDTPVVCSFNSALKEFAGPGVFYFDPCDSASLDAACSELLSRRPCAIERPDLQARCSWDALVATILSLANGG